jgi:hypothetical protein
MNYELRCQKLCEKYRENPAELNHVDKGLEDYQAANFWHQVKVAGSDECWTWLGHCDPAGYGDGCIAGNVMRSHKVAWCLAHDLSAVPAGKRLLITCNNRACCNPAHIAVGRIKFVGGKREKIVTEPAIAIAPTDIIRNPPEPAKIPDGWRKKRFRVGRKWRAKWIKDE